MQLIHLSLENFRNFSRLDIDVPGGTVVLVGQNAQGKTSLLEAVYFLATLTSFHAGNDRELVHFVEAQSKTTAVARITAQFKKHAEDTRTHRLEIRVIQEQLRPTSTPRVRKEILLNKSKIKMADVLGQFNAVLFLPQMMRIIDGPPEHRRRYLDSALSQVIPGYARTLSKYQKFVSRRNALLKQLGEQGGDPDQLSYWDDQVSIFGAQIIQARFQALQELEILAARLHSSLTRKKETLRLSYRPSYDPMKTGNGQFEFNLDDRRDRSGYTLESLQQGFCSALEARRGEEISRGVTTIGPHRDELRFVSNRIDLGIYGSRGQVRTALLTLKLAELDWMKERTGFTPVLLLDEVLAELDYARRADLLERVSACEQAMLTTTDLNLFETGFVDAADVWRIEEGRVTERL